MSFFPVWAHRLAVSVLGLTVGCRVTIHVEQSICFKVLKSVHPLLHCVPLLGSLAVTHVPSHSRRTETAFLFYFFPFLCIPSDPLACPFCEASQPLASIEGTRKVIEMSADRRRAAAVASSEGSRRCDAWAMHGHAAGSAPKDAGRHARLINRSRSMLLGAFFLIQQLAYICVVSHQRTSFSLAIVAVFPSYLHPFLINHLPIL